MLGGLRKRQRGFVSPVALPLIIEARCLFCDLKVLLFNGEFPMMNWRERLVKDRSA